MNKHVIVYLVIDKTGKPVDCKLSRVEAREVERRLPKTTKVVRSIATPAPRPKGGA